MSRPIGTPYASLHEATPIGGTHGYAVFVTSRGIEIRGYDGLRIPNSAMTISESKRLITLLERGIAERRDQIKRKR